MRDLDVDHFLRLERRVWHALVEGDPELDSSMLSADFLGVYETGFADRNTHAAELAGGPTVATYELRDARLLPITDTAVMLAYRADYRRAAAGSDAEVEAMYVSSLWCERDGRWCNVFSQDTPVVSPELP
jgi:hypothetical protein